MSIFRILSSRLRKHSLYHLMIPLGSGIVGEIVVDNFIISNKRWIGFFSGVIISYVIVMYFLIKNETRKRIEEGSLAKLQDTLDDAISYYGVSVIPVTEWFDPAIQVYLAKLLNRKLEPDDFEHERTLLFFSNREYKNAKVPLVDENHFGRCLALMHRDCDIPLSFISRKDIFEILDKLSPEDKQALGCYPRWTNCRFFRLFRKLPLRLLRRRIKQLDFALVKSGSELSVLAVSKRGEEVRIKKKIKGEAVEPYRRLVQLIKDRVYDSDTKELHADYDFVRSYGYEKRFRTKTELQSSTGVNLDKTKWEISYEDIAPSSGSSKQPELAKKGAPGKKAVTAESPPPAVKVATVELNQYGSRIMGQGRDITGRRWIVEGATSERRVCYIYFDPQGQRLSFGAVLLELDNSGTQMAGQWVGWAPESNELRPRKVTLKKLSD